MSQKIDKSNNKITEEKSKFDIIPELKKNIIVSINIIKINIK